MEFHAADPIVLTNANVVAADRVFPGWVAIDQGAIVEVDEGRGPKGGIDCQGDYLLPGLVELHTDHLEAHFMPRPRVFWHAGSAVMAYDAQIAAAGITTVFDSFRVGMDEHEDWRSGVGDQVVTLADAIERARAADLLRADHQTHLRCEIPSPNVVEFLEQFLASRPARLVSLMDHTPGQRQFRDLDKYFIYYQGKTGKSEHELAEVVRERQRVGRAHAEANRPRIVTIAQAHGLTLASHDDTTLEDVDQAKREGVHIAEFPTTHEAAAASRQAGMATVMGAPNVVRGGSHSGNASARDFADAGLLDILSSDYVPAALLMAAFRLADVANVGGLAGATRMVTKNPAEAAGLIDRGEIVVGRRADLVRVRSHYGEPVVRAVWREGQRVA
jgi:alpha-D-ribose 1-methylphosphonate 5-triphosphate diphosphatase